jgi:hypothetical protein
MWRLTDQALGTVATLVAMIARSPIRLTAPARPLRCRLDEARLPAGFEEVDVAILDWIAAEARRMGRRVVLM